MILLYPDWEPAKGERWLSIVTLLIETESGTVDYAKLRSTLPIETASIYIYVRNWATLRVNPYDPVRNWVILRVDPYDPNDQTQYDGYEFPNFYNKDHRS